MPRSARTLARTALFGLPLLTLSSSRLGAQPPKMERHYPVQAAVSPPLRKVRPAPVPQMGKYLRELLPAPGAHQKPVHDPAVQTATPTPATAVVSEGFEGIGAVVPGQAVAAIPPDANIAVGPNHIVQWVNVYFAVYDKTGNLLMEPLPGNALWANAGGACATYNRGDPIVQYDRLHDRWVMTQFAFPSVSGPYYQCWAVSQTGDPLGEWNLYAYQFTYFNDYTKAGVWPSAYFTSHNMFLSIMGILFPMGAEACAYNGEQMRAGVPALAICYQIGDKLSLVPADLDGADPPADGAAGLFMNYGGNYASLNLFRFAVNFANPDQSTWQGPISLPTGAFNLACGNGGTCIPQAGVTQQLDSLGDRMMYRLAYRRFADHESLTINQSVAANGVVGIRWYEIRDPYGSPGVYQYGTYAPDSTYRWMGSMAMDKAGNIAVGYSRASTAMHPSIYIAGWETTDPLGQLQAELEIVAGTGSQTGYSRWGDYTAMRIDPADDCTFWYTNQYLPEDGNFNWHTRIASFSFPSCTAGTAPDFAVSVAPASVSALAGTTASYTVTVTPSGGFSDNVALSVAGLPGDAFADFEPATVTGGGGASSLSISNTPPGTYSLTIAGASGSTTHSAPATLTVTDFTISAAPPAQTVAAGASATYTVTVGSVNGFSGPVALSADALPAGATAVFTPPSITGFGTSTLTISNAPAGSYTITITGASGPVSHSASVDLTVTPAPDFTITAVPPLQQLLAGQIATLTITITRLNGFSEPVSLGVAGHPASAPIEFSPQTIPSGSVSSTLTIGPNNMTYGDYTLTITGNGGGLTRSATALLKIVDFSLSVTPASRTVNRGRQTTFKLTATPLNGFAGAVTLGLTGNPANTSVSFNPQPLSLSGGSATSVLTITVSRSAVKGTSALTISGSNSTLTHQTSAALTIR